LAAVLARVHQVNKPFELQVAVLKALAQKLLT
jgi:hypothetical protein